MRGEEREGEGETNIFCPSLSELAKEIDQMDTISEFLQEQDHRHRGRQRRLCARSFTMCGQSIGEDMRRDRLPCEGEERQRSREGGGNEPQRII
jgi:hypothetical protein